MSSMFSPSSSLVDSGVGGWGSGVTGLIDVLCVTVMVDSLSDFISNIELIMATVFFCWSTCLGWETWILDPPTSNRGALVEIFCIVVNILEGQIIVGRFLDLFPPCFLLPHLWSVQRLVGGVRGWSG